MAFLPVCVADGGGDLGLGHHYQVVDQIAARCTDPESGARNIDHIVNRTLLPLISTQILERIGDATEYKSLDLTIGEHGEFVTTFSA